MSRLRLVALAGLLAVLVLYYTLHEHLWNASTWWDVAWLSLVLMPAVFALVWLLLPLRTARGLLILGLAIGGASYGLEQAGLELVSNFGKLAAMTALAFWFLTYFENVYWVTLIALIVPVVDAYSVWRGPTNHIVKQQAEVFETLSFSFPIPGEQGAANLGLPDLLFFGLFLAASHRFGLRPGWTWLALTASFGSTMALAVWRDPFGIGGLPALPLLSIAFLVANGDLVWRRYRDRPRPAEPEAET